MSDEHASEERVISVVNVSKAYGIPYSLSADRALGVFTKGLKAFRRTDMAPALKGVSMEVRRGELVGVIGRNGAGKSTLLKLISGVSIPSAGKVKVEGRIFPMIELNAGMNPRLTGRENIYLLAAIMGIKKSTVEERMEDIEEFCDLGQFFDMPVRTYSSGMPGRLGFAVAVHADADIVLIDEVLSVGDANFRERCTNKMEELRDSGKTLVLVSHNMGAISALCTRTIVLDQGEVKFEGETAAAIRFYSDLLRAAALTKIKRVTEKAAIAAAPPLKTVRVYDLQVTPGPGEPPSAFDARNGLSIAFSFSSKVEMEQVFAFVEISNETGLVLVEHRKVHALKDKIARPRRATFVFENGAPLKGGSYIVRGGVKDRSGAVVLGSVEQTIVTSGGDKAHGAIAPKIRGSVEWLERPAEARPEEAVSS